jgi:hypothetical protein
VTPHMIAILSVVASIVIMCPVSLAIGFLHEELLPAPAFSSDAYQKPWPPRRLLRLRLHRCLTWVGLRTRLRASLVLRAVHALNPFLTPCADPKGSAKYCVSCATFTPLNSMMLKE